MFLFPYPLQVRHPIASPLQLDLAQSFRLAWKRVCMAGLDSGHPDGIGSMARN